MSFQELRIKALEEQVVNLTRDCHYLMSLLNQTDEIDWDNWPQGRKIKEDLEHSKDFFKAIQCREEKQNELRGKHRENARAMAEYLKQKAAEEKAREENRKRDIKLGMPWNRKKIDNFLFEHKSFDDVQKMIDYIFQSNF